MSDIEEFPLGLDETRRPNLFRPYDLGAHEANWDVLFINGFQPP